MLKQPGRLNSKGFLLTYLFSVMLILALWRFEQEKTEPDHRILPEKLSPHLTSPARLLPQILLHDEQGKILTNAMLEQRWTWMYFTHPRCLPECMAILTVLDNLQRSFAATDNQFILIDYDIDTQRSMRELLAEMKMDFTVYTATELEMLQPLMDKLGFLFLKPNNANDHYIEQYHHIYLIDPKGRLYAVFNPPFTSVQLHNLFVEIRGFYARTE